LGYVTTAIEPCFSALYVTITTPFLQFKRDELQTQTPHH